MKPTNRQERAIRIIENMIEVIENKDDKFQADFRRPKIKAAALECLRQAIEDIRAGPYLDIDDLGAA